MKFTEYTEPRQRLRIVYISPLEIFKYTLFPILICSSLFINPPDIKLLPNNFNQDFCNSFIVLLGSVAILYAFVISYLSSEKHLKRTIYVLSIFGFLLLVVVASGVFLGLGFSIPLAHLIIFIFLNLLFSILVAAFLSILGFAYNFVAKGELSEGLIIEVEQFKSLDFQLDRTEIYKRVVELEVDIESIKREVEEIKRGLKGQSYSQKISSQKKAPHPVKVRAFRFDPDGQCLTRRLRSFGMATLNP